MKTKFKVPPYKKGKFYYIVHFIQGSHITVERVKYLGYEKPSFCDYPTLLFGDCKKHLSHYPCYTDRPFDPTISGMTIALTKQKAHEYVRAHREEAYKNISEDKKRFDKTIKNSMKHLQSLDSFLS